MGHRLVRDLDRRGVVGEEREREREREREKGEGELLSWSRMTRCRTCGPSVAVIVMVCCVYL